MSTFLLVVIYLSFISLGLPDSLLGSAWPVMQPELSIPLSGAGFISVIVTCGTVVSSLLSERVIFRFGTGRVTAVSVLMTASALLGNALSPSMFWLCLWAVPLGLGAGAVDAALNNFVALHYQARHMSWLHCFWGLGATLGPIIMSLNLEKAGGWRSGYGIIAVIQFVLSAVLLITLPLWRRESDEQAESSGARAVRTPMGELVKIPGVKSALSSFFFYCAAELTTGLWGSTYLVAHKGVSVERAAQWLSLYYFGITIGRFLSGFVTIRYGSKALIRLGQGVSLLGVLLLFGPALLSAVGFLLIGLGFAPLYPGLIHETPARFGRNVSQGLIGLQMACAYMGNTLVPPLFGLIAKRMGAVWFAPFLALLVLLTAFFCENTNRVVTQRARQSEAR